MWDTTDATCFFPRRKRTEGIFFPDTRLKLLGQPKMCPSQWIKGPGKIADPKHLLNITLTSVSKISLFKTPFGLIVQTGFLRELTHFRMPLLFHQTNQQANFLSTWRNQVTDLELWLEGDSPKGSGRGRISPGDVEKAGTLKGQSLFWKTNSSHWARLELFVSLWWCEFWQIEAFFVSNLNIQMLGWIFTPLGLEVLSPQAGWQHFVTSCQLMCMCVHVCMCTWVQAAACQEGCASVHSPRVNCRHSEDVE